MRYNRFKSVTLAFDPFQPDFQIADLGQQSGQVVTRRVAVVNREVRFVHATLQVRLGLFDCGSHFTLSSSSSLRNSSLRLSMPRLTIDLLSRFSW